MGRLTRRVAIVAFDRAQGLDIVGPLDALDVANEVVGGSAPAYELLIIATRRGPITVGSGLSLLPKATLNDCPTLDTVIVPGGVGIRVNVALRRRIATWLKERAPRIRRVASVCTGIYALAESGLLDGRRATTHWRFAADVSAQWPKIELQPNAIYVRSGDRYYTSAGITAGIDLALAMIEEDHGGSVAINVARELVVYVKRPGGQLQFSEPLRLQERAGCQFADTISWMLERLDGDLSVESLARHAHMSSRHFARRFKESFHATPAEMVESLRLDHARWLLSNDETPLEELAAAVGYRSDDSFRRAFVRRFGTAPSDYRRRFAAQR